MDGVRHDFLKKRIRTLRIDVCAKASSVEFELQVFVTVLTASVLPVAVRIHKSSSSARTGVAVLKTLVFFFLLHAVQLLFYACQLK